MIYVLIESVGVHWAFCLKSATLQIQCQNPKNMWILQIQKVVVMQRYSAVFLKMIIKPPLATAERLNAMGLSICLSVCFSVCLSVAKMQKNAIFWKTKQFRAMVSIDDL